MERLNSVAIGEKIRKLRGERTQKEVADALGVTVMAISNYESGGRIPNDSIKLSMAQYFGVSVDDLFFAKQ